MKGLGMKLACNTTLDSTKKSVLWCGRHHNAVADPVGEHRAFGGSGGEGVFLACFQRLGGATGGKGSIAVDEESEVSVGIGDSVLTAVGDGVLTAVGDGVLTAVGDRVLTAVGDGVLTAVGDGVLTAVGDRVLTTVGGNDRVGAECHDHGVVGDDVL